MKRKYAALVLGLALTLTSMNAVYATDSAKETAEASATDTAAAEDTLEAEEGDTSADAVDTENEEASQELYGEVKEIGENGITISLGEPKNPDAMLDVEIPEDGDLQEEEIPQEEDAVDADAEDTGTQEDPAAEEEITEENSDEDTLDEAFSVEYIPSFELDFTGEEQTVSVTENTLFERNVTPDAEEEIAEEAEETEAEEITEIEDNAQAEADGSEDSTEAEETPSEDNGDAEGTEGENTTETAEAEVEIPDGGVESILIEEDPEMETEAIVLEEIQAGDIVKITLDPDGNAAKVTVLVTAQEMSGEEVSSEAAEEETPAADAEEISADTESEAEVNAETEDSTDAQ